MPLCHRLKKHLLMPHRNKIPTSKYIKCEVSLLIKGGLDYFINTNNNETVLDGMNA